MGRFTVLLDWQGLKDTTFPIVLCLISFFFWWSVAPNT